MTKKRLNSLIKHSRTRSGCLTCRDRHMKCDEQQPVCRNCIKSKRKCYRGVRLNFTQYTIYNPEESTKSLPSPTQNFRILDQSITIASLYENGKRSYEPYLHLHNPQDLQESDFHYQEGIYPAFTPRSQSVSHPQVSNALEISPSSRNEIMPSSIPISSIVPNHSVPSDNVSPIQSRIPFDHNNIILENFDITNLLLNDLYFIHQYFQNSPSNPDATVSTAPASDPNLPPYSNPQSQMISSNFNVPYLSPSISRNPTAHSKVYFWDEIDFPKSINIESYTLLIDKEKYYRFLDLFNELDVWKSMIPSYCLFDFINFENTLLLDCLMNCSEKSQINLSDLLNRQLFYWVNCRSSPVDTPQKVKPFEDLLVSIALILLSIQRKVGKYNLQDIHVVLINQIKIYNKILVKLQDYLKSKLPKSVILISAIHSIVILKFFIIKSYDIEIDFDYINSTDNSIVLEDKQLENKVNLNGEFNNPDNTKDSGTNFYPRFNFLPEDIEEVILYSDPTKINLYQLNEFEIILLNDLFKNLDYQQQNHQYKLDSHLKSDASKLRDHTWLVIRENYMRFNSSNADSSFSSSHSRNIALPAFLDNNVILPNLHRAESTSRSPVTKLKDQAEEGSLRWSTSDETPISRISSTSSLPGKSGSEAGSTNVSVKAVLPNQRGIAMNLLREYINKLENEENEEIINNCNFKIESIFKLIYESTMDATIKRHWHRDFRWLLNPNFASAYASVDNRKRSPS